MKNIIRVSDVAKEMNRDKSNCFKMLKKAGIPIAFIYDDENDNSRGQKIAVIRISDFEAFKNARMQLQPK